MIFLCAKGRPCSLQVWLLFTEVWAQSQGILALSYTRLAVYPLVVPQGFAEVQLHDELQQPLCCGCASHSCHFPFPLLPLALHTTPLGKWCTCALGEGVGAAGC